MIIEIDAYELLEMIKNYGEPIQGKTVVRLEITEEILAIIADNMCSHRARIKSKKITE